VRISPALDDMLSVELARVLIDGSSAPTLEWVAAKLFDVPLQLQLAITDEVGKLQEAVIVALRFAVSRLS